MEEQKNQTQEEVKEEVKSEPQANNAAPSDSKDIEENKGITYLSYLGLLFLVPLLVKKDSKFAMFHAKQGLVLTIGWFLGGFLYFMAGLGFLVHLAIIVFSIMGLVSVSKGEMKKLPIVGDLAEKFNI